MSKLIPRLSAAEMAPELAEMLRPRVERLGYLGEFFQCSGHQPEALMSFLSWTEDLKQALPDSLTELVALTVASWMGNAYERVQHERLALKLGLTEPWLRAVLSLRPDTALTETEKLVQKLVLALMAKNGHGTQAELEAVVRATDHVTAVAILMLTGRYMTHALMVNALELAPPVTSPLEGNPARPGQPLWISESEVTSMMDMPGAIDALSKGLLAEARGDAKNMVKTHAVWGDGSTLHAIGAVFTKEGFAGTKTWAHTKGGATPLLILFDSQTGALAAIIEAFALGQLRTASASGVATRLLAAEDAAELAVIGTGKQALPQVAAVVAVRPIRRVRVFGRDPERRARFAQRVNREFGLDVMEAGTVAEAAKGAPIVTVVTRAEAPILFPEMLARGAHINAVGAIVPTRAEIAAGVLGRCGRVVCDSVPQAQKLSRELIDHFGPDPSGWKHVQSLGDLVAASQKRDAGEDLTLFKALGMGISDLSLGIKLYRDAVRLGLGRFLSQPKHLAI